MPKHLEQNGTLAEQFAALLDGTTACAEFPNDNPRLHRGAVWRGERLGDPICEPAASSNAPTSGTERDAAQDAAIGDAAPDQATGTEMTLDEDGSFEVVEEISIDDAVDEFAADVAAPAVWSISETVGTTEPTEQEDTRELGGAADPFAELVRAMHDVARDAGGSPSHLRLLLALTGQSRMDRVAVDDATIASLVGAGIAAPSARGLARTAAFTAQVAAWQGILRGESDDFGACGAAALDEWAAALVGRALGAPQRADLLRRELRARGVAAFGLVTNAA